MRPYVDPTLFGDQLGFSLKKTLKKAKKAVSKAAKITEKAVKDVGKATEDVVTYSPIQGKPTSYRDVIATGGDIGAMALGVPVPVGSIITGRVPFPNAIGIPSSTPGGPDLSAYQLALAPPEPTVSWTGSKKAAALIGVALLAFYFWRRRGR